MRKYMVIDTCEREIGEPEFFNSLEKAQIRLFNMFCIACGHIKEVVIVSNKEEMETQLALLVKYGVLDDENNLTDMSAWATTSNHDNWDGKIIEVNLPTLF